MSETAIAIQGFDYSPYSQKFVKQSKSRAKKIRGYDAEAGRNLIEQGGLLKEQRGAFGNEVDRKQARGADTWGAWVLSELGWHIKYGRDHANRLIQIHERFDTVATTVSLGHEMMKVLSAKSTPDELVAEVIDLAERGKLPTVKSVRDKKKALVADPRPTPTEAKRIAKETRAVVLGSDDRYYTPMEEEDLADYDERMNRSYAVVEAIEEIATTVVTPGEWINNAESQWLDELSIGSIEVAISWLNILLNDYKSHRKVIENGD